MSAARPGPNVGGTAEVSFRPLVGRKAFFVACRPDKSVNNRKGEDNMKQRLADLREQALAELKAVEDAAALDSIRVK